MEKNPCYEDHTVPVYEEVQLQDNAEQTDVKLTERSASNFADNTNKIYAATSIKKAKCVPLVVVLSLLAIAMVAAIALSVYALVSSNQGMEILQLMQEIQELKMQLNKAKGASETEIADLKKDLNYTLTQIKGDGLILQNSLNTTNTANLAQLNSLQSSVSTLESVLNGLGPGQVSAAINVISSLESSVSSLATRVNSPVNLYQNCIQETRSCTRSSVYTYWTSCTTSSLPVNKPGYYKLNIECKYDPRASQFDTTALRQSGANIHCLCGTVSTPSSSTGEHYSRFFDTYTCKLVITRCPISQNIV